LSATGQQRFSPMSADSFFDPPEHLLRGGIGASFVGALHEITFLNSTPRSPGGRLARQSKRGTSRRNNRPVRNPLPALQHAGLL